MNTCQITYYKRPIFTVERKGEFLIFGENWLKSLYLCMQNNVRNKKIKKAYYNILQGPFRRLLVALPSLRASHILEYFFINSTIVASISYNNSCSTGVYRVMTALAQVKKHESFHFHSFCVRELRTDCINQRRVTIIKLLIDSTL